MGRKNDETLELVREAIDQLRRGDIADALTTLERCAYPKWESINQCGVALAKSHMERIAFEEAAAAASEGGAI